MIVADSTIIAPNGRPAILEAIENNWYEGSRWSPNRSWVWFPVQDAKKDLDRFTRYELSKHARYLYKNSPFIRGLIKRINILTIGNGFHPVFKSESNPKWAKKAQALWVKRRRNINLGYKASFSQYQRAIGMARSLDGECFTIKTFSETSMENRVQAVEADRCCGDASKLKGLAENGSPGTVDGINLNWQGEPQSYSFRGVAQPYSAQDIVHHYTADRPEQYRGETVLASAINTARDVDDILALEKQCVKDASSKQDVIKTQTGELNKESFRALQYGTGSAGGAFPTTIALPQDDLAKDNYYRVKFGASPVVLKKGDEYTPYKPDRPGAAWQGFMDFLSNTICLSTGFPPSVVLPIDLGGTDIRRDLDIAQRVVEPIQGDICLELEDIVMYLLQGDLYDGELSDQPDDWKLVWHFPPKLNVDRSQAQQDRQDVQAGIMSWEEYHGRYGDDGDEYEQTIISEAKRRRQRIFDAGFIDDEGEADINAFVQVLSLDSKLFVGAAANEGKETENVQA